MPSATSSSTHSSKRYNTGHLLARTALVTGALSFIAALMAANLSVRSVSALNAPIVNNLNNASLLAWGPTAQKSIGAIVGNIILALLGLLGVVFVVLLTYGGFLWLTAAGEEEKVKKAQGLIIHSIIGLCIVIAATIIAYFILQKLVAAV